MKSTFGSRTDKYFKNIIKQIDKYDILMEDY